MRGRVCDSWRQEFECKQRTETSTSDKQQAHFESLQTENHPSDQLKDFSGHKAYTFISQSQKINFKLSHQRSISHRADVKLHEEAGTHPQICPGSKQTWPTTQRMRR